MNNGDPTLALSQMAKKIEKLESLTYNLSIRVPGLLEINRIILLNPGTKASYFEVSAVGLTAALTAAASGSIVYVPSGTIIGNFTVPEGGGLIGSGPMSRINGTVTLGDGAYLNMVYVSATGSDASYPICAVIGPTPGSASVDQCTLYANNSSTGGAFAGFGRNGGTLKVFRSAPTAISNGTEVKPFTDTTDRDPWGSASPQTYVINGSRVLPAGTTESFFNYWSGDSLYGDNAYYIWNLPGTWQINSVSMTFNSGTIFMRGPLGVYYFFAGGGSYLDQKSGYNPNGDSFTSVHKCVPTYIQLVCPGDWFGHGNIQFYNLSVNYQTSPDNYATEVMVDGNVMTYLSGLPMLGDRSASDSLHYPSLHTNDTDSSAGALHHTLGTGAGQAAPGNDTRFHDPVTVLDTATLDLTLTGQQISGTVLGAPWSGISGKPTYFPADWDSTLTNIPSDLAKTDVANLFTAAQTIQSTTQPQLQVGYDSSNYIAWSIGSDGKPTMNMTGTSKIVSWPDTTELVIGAASNPYAGIAGRGLTLVRNGPAEIDVYAIASAGAQVAVYHRLFAFRGSPSSPTATQTSDGASVGLAGYGTTAWVASAKASINFYAAENWTDSAQGTFITLNTTPIGSTTRAERVRINSTGNVSIGIAGELTNGGKLQVAGSADAIQLMVKANSTQTNDIFQFQKSDGTNYFRLTGAGSLALTNTNTAISGYPYAYSVSLATQPTADSSSNTTASVIKNNFISAFAEAQIVGGEIDSYNYGTGLITDQIGVFGRAVGTPTTGVTAQATTVIPFYGSLGMEGAGTFNIANAYAVYSLTYVSSGTLNITNWNGIRVDSPTVYGGALNITNAYGIIVRDIVKGGTVNYAIYTGKGLNRFGDQISVLGSQDAIQMLAKGFSTQTNPIFEVQKSDGTVLESTDNSGNKVLAGTIKTALGNAWDLGVYTTTAPSATGYVSIKIGGVTYKLLAST